MMRIGYLALALSAVAIAPIPEPARAAAGYAVLTCDMTSASDPAAAQRIFRIAPHSLQEWKASQREFGSNLCLAHTCSVDKRRLTGTISSSSLTITVTLERAAQHATWRAVGASGLSKSSGTCTVGPDVPPATAAR